MDLYDFQTQSRTGLGFGMSATRCVMEEADPAARASSS